MGVDSVKTHGTAGDFKLPLVLDYPLTGRLGIEPRFSSDPLKLIFTFNSAVSSIGSVTAVSANGTFYPVDSATANGNEVTITINGVPDSTLLGVRIANVNDGTKPAFVTLGTLLGDANRSGNVDAADKLPIRAHSGRAVDAALASFDVNGSGLVSVADLAAAKARNSRVIQGGTPPTGMAAVVPSGTGAIAYVSQPFSAVSTLPVQWALASGSLPAGLSIDTITGRIVGVPLAEGTFSFKVRAGNGTKPDWLSPQATLDVAPALRSIEGSAIPYPSKLPGQNGALHPGLNGAGSSINAWSVAVSRCNNTQPAIARLWHHNIPFFNYGLQSASDTVAMAPNEALTYQFSVGEDDLDLQGKVSLLQSVTAFYPGAFVSISETPCDFDVSALSAPTRNYCYVSGTGQFDLYYRVTFDVPQLPFQCRLVPNKTYYLNLRWQQATSFPAIDSCAMSGQANCGALVVIQAN